MVVVKQDTFSRFNKEGGWGVNNLFHFYKELVAKNPIECDF